MSVAGCRVLKNTNPLKTQQTKCCMLERSADLLMSESARCSAAAEQRWFVISDECIRPTHTLGGRAAPDACWYRVCSCSDKYHFPNLQQLLSRWLLGCGRGESTSSTPFHHARAAVVVHGTLVKTNGHVFIWYFRKLAYRQYHRGQLTCKAQVTNLKGRLRRDEKVRALNSASLDSSSKPQPNIFALPTVCSNCASISRAVANPLGGPISLHRSRGYPKTQLGGWVVQGNFLKLGQHEAVHKPQNQGTYHRVVSTLTVQHCRMPHGLNH
jgi:hypothetical protein